MPRMFGFLKDAIRLLQRTKKDLCTHTDPLNAEYWECTYITRAGGNYVHRYEER